MSYVWPCEFGSVCVGLLSAWTSVRTLCEGS